MQYIIFVGTEDEEQTMLSRPVDEADARYLRENVLPRMRPLSDADYENGPAAIFHTFARFSYVLDDRDVYWCVEWEPGLLALRFAPGGAMWWAAVDSPNPEFGGRDATPEELDAYDEDAENPQYNLVFEALGRAVRGGSPGRVGRGRSGDATAV